MLLYGSHETADITAARSLDTRLTHIGTPFDDALAMYAEVVFADGNARLHCDGNVVNTGALEYCPPMTILLLASVVIDVVVLTALDPLMLVVNWTVPFGSYLTIYPT
jgi:hypothetical protein